jgi:hypothetical protein
MFTTSFRAAPVLASLTLALAVAAPAHAQSKSSAAAKQLAQALDRAKLDSIAAPDPSGKDSFVAALYFPGSQLLVVSAQYSAPSLLMTRLDKKEYREIYIDLNAASVAGTKLFVIDQGADGLSPRPEDGAADTWERANTTTVFDGEWRKAKMSEEEYLKTHAEAEEHYARMLTLLAQQAQKTSGS